MRYTVSAPGTPIHAAIQLPASKSISNRALILHALAHGKQTVSYTHLTLPTIA